MDISELEVVDTAPIHIKGPDGTPLYTDGKPVCVIVYGPASDAFARLETKQTQRAFKRLDENDGKKTALTAEERLTQSAEDLADVTYEVEGLTSGDKKGRDLFLAIYGNRKLGYIANQVAAKLGDWGNFKVVSAAD